MEKSRKIKNCVLFLGLCFLALLFLSPVKIYAADKNYTPVISGTEEVRGMAIDCDNRIWVGYTIDMMGSYSYINKYDSAGKLISTVYSINNITAIAAMTFDEGGNNGEGAIWITGEGTPGNYYICRSNLGGTSSTSFKIDIIPIGIAIDSDGDIWVSGTKNNIYYIEEYRASSQPSFASEGIKNTIQMDHVVTGLAKDSNGDILVAGNGKILKYSHSYSDGDEPMRTIETNNNSLGIVTDESNNIWATSGSGTILKYDFEGKPLQSDTFTSSPLLGTISKLAIDSSGVLWGATGSSVIKFAVNTYTLTYNAGENGTISGTSPQTVNQGGSGTEVTAVANPGYHFVSWSDGNTNASRTDTNVTANVSVTASFAVNTYTLTYTAGENGTISGASPQTVNQGESGTEVTAVANPGYHFVSWSDGNTNVSRTDTNVTANVSVTASFAADAPTTHTLTYNAESHGTVSGTAVQVVNNGASGAPVTAVADTGYHFVIWSDAVTTASRTDTNVTADKSVTASFAADAPTTHILTYNAGSHGIVSGTAVQVVSNGAIGAPVTAVADTGYHFVIWSDGVTTATRTDSNVSEDIHVVATFVADTPAPNYGGGDSSGSSGSATSLPENKTITVVEAPKSIPSSDMITVEPVGSAFDQSIEVRLKDDKATESTIRATMEAISSTLDAENVQIFPLDISLYIKGTDTKVQPAEGTAVKITCPIPTELLAQKDKLVVVSVIDGKLQIIETTVITISGVSCVEFIATHFSPYAFVLDTDGKLADLATGNTAPDHSNSIKVATKMTVSAGTLTKNIIENLPQNATVAYHVCTPNYISINSKGELFAKKSGKAILMAAITVDKTTTVHTITITVKKAKAATKVGFIQYYDDLITYKNINYRITLKATKTAAGTVAVGNNQLNEKLSTKVVIPSKVTLDGKTYNVTSIDESAFYNVNSIKSVSIPYTVKNISETAFTSCDKLKTFIVESDNLNYTAKKSMLLDKTGIRLIAYPSASGKVVLDSKITTIGAYAFSACKNLSEIIIPKTVTRIEGSAFANSKALSKVTFQSVTVPEIPFLCLFEGINQGCVILVPDKAISFYQTAFENARQPKGIVIMKK